MNDAVSPARPQPYLDGEGHLLPSATFADQGLRPLPWEFYAAMRRDDPVHYDPKIDMYLVTKYEDLQQIFADPMAYSVYHGYDEQFAKGFEAEFK